MTWFNFGKNREEAKREQRAFERGQEVAREIGKQLDAILDERYGHVKPNFLQVLSDGLDRDVAQKDHSPLLCARANLADYIDNVAERVPDMAGDILAIMSAWRDGFEQNGMPGFVEDFVQKRLANWQVDMQTSGIKLVSDRGEELIAADNLWRIQHPSQAELEPLDN